ncbi:MAG: RagB/SusD family nutrient uptake outer membrane protein [Prevotella sp.]
MKAIFKYIFGALACCSLASCNDYLEIYPENSLPADKFWATKADVESELMSGYYILRNSVISNLIPWGEFRSGCLTSSLGTGTNILQKWEIKSSNTSYCSWANMYRIVNTANLVLEHASEAMDNDDTYRQEELNSHYCEAYFLRALAFFYIVRNWRDAPLTLEAYDTDEVPYALPKSSAAEILAQIKADLYEAERLNAAKEVFETTWETKGRGTKWAIYALMADVCLWNSDFDEAIKYADLILNSTSPNAPRFMSSANRNSWFSMFNPGNSNESIFELQWNHEKYDAGIAQTNDLPYIFNNVQNTSYSQYRMSDALLEEFKQDYTDISMAYLNQPDMAVRTLYGTCNENSGTCGPYIWKYIGGTSRTDKRTETYYDPNFIIYRVAEVMLIKAEALVMRNLGGNATDYQAAIDIVNDIRKRTNLTPDEGITALSSAGDILDYILSERLKELAAEGKSWYDMLRLGHYPPSNGIDFKTRFLINNVIKYNGTASDSWIRSVLSNENAWYLPITDNEIKYNQNLVQNPYYL